LAEPRSGSLFIRRKKAHPSSVFPPAWIDHARAGTTRCARVRNGNFRALFEAIEREQKNKGNAVIPD